MAVRRPSWLNIKSIKDFFLPSLFLVLAFLLAVLSSMARHDGQLRAAVFLAVVSLIFAFIVCVTLVPRLLSRVSLEFLNNLRFFRFTQRGAYFVLIVFIISFATFNTGNNLLILILSFLLASMVVSGIVANLVLYGLKISLNLPEAVHAGQKAVFLITLYNLKKFFPSFALRLKGEEEKNSEETDFFLQEKTFPYVRAGQRIKLSLYCEFAHRGIYPVEGFEIKTTFPFGFFWRGRKLDANGRILVYPALLDLNPLSLDYNQQTGTVERNRRGLGSELYNIRDYQSGDNARFVHWKSSAKLKRLMVKDFAQEHEKAVHIAFSTYLPDRSELNLQQFEKAVSYVTSLAHHYRNRRREFQFSSGEFEVTVNGQKQQYNTLMRYLARVQPADQVQLDTQKLTTPCVLFWAGSTGAHEGLSQIDYLQL
jgi:uncharacterized protein (DUF58 family)